MIIDHKWLTTSTEETFQFKKVTLTWTVRDSLQKDLLIKFKLEESGFLTETFLILKCFNEGYAQNFSEARLFLFYYEKNTLHYKLIDNCVLDYGYTAFINYFLNKNVSYSINSDETTYTPLTGVELRYITDLKIDQYLPKGTGCDYFLNKIAITYERFY